MKKHIKIAIGIVLLAAALAGGAYYMARPVKIGIVLAAEQVLTESLQLEGTVVFDETEVVTADTNGIITDIRCRPGDSVAAGEELILVDDSEYQQEIADEITLLEKQKDAVYNQNYMNGLEIKLQQEQLIEVMDTARHEFDMMFGENGTAYNDADAAKWAFEAAQASLAAANQANDDWENAKHKNPDLYTGSAPFSGTQLAAYEAAAKEAEAARKNAELFTSEKNILYYHNMMLAYQTRFDTLTELGNRNAKSAGQEESRIQLSIDALVRKQAPDKIAAEKGGIVSELLVEEGSYVTQHQPLVRIYDTDKKKLEAWMLTEDACDYQVGDSVSMELPDGTKAEETITFISPVAEERISTLGISENRCRVELTAENVPVQFGPGYEMTLRFARELSGKTVNLPVSALVSENQETFVYLVENGKCKKTPVITGAYSGGMAEITEGLTPGAKVVESPADYDLKDGASVEVK